MSAWKSGRRMLGCKLALTQNQIKPCDIASGHATQARCPHRPNFQQAAGRGAFGGKLRPIHYETVDVASGFIGPVRGQHSRAGRRLYYHR